MYGKRLRDVRLPNGARVLVHTVPTPDVGIGIFIPFGYMYEGLDEIGITHLLEHTVFRKNTHYRYRDINRLMKRYGNQSRFDAETTGTCALYYARVLPRNLASAWRLLSSMVFRSTFPYPAVTREKRIIVNELSDLEEDPEFLATRALIESIYPTHPMRNDVIDTPERTKVLDRGKVLARYREFYRPSHATIVFVGNIPSRVALRLVGELQDTNEGIYELPTFAETKPPRSHNIRIERKGLERAFIYFGFRAPSMRDKEFPAMRILEYLLVRGFDSPLKQFVREQTGCAYNMPDEYDYSHCHGLYSVGALVFPRELARVSWLIQRAVRYVQKNVTQDNFLLNRRALLNDIEMEKGSVIERIHQIGESALWGGTLDHEFVEQLYKVTRDEVVEVARRFLDLDNAVEVIVRPA